MTADASPRAAEPLVRPPRLQVGGESTASRLELFFDLAYVLVVLELAEGFYEHLSLHGFAVMTGLFVAVWVSWVGFTLYANRFDTDDVVFRVAKLAATGAIAGCAAAASDAVGRYAVPFAVCFLLGRVLLFVLYLRAYRHVAEARPTIRVYLLCTGLSSVLWAVSLAVPSEARYWVWGAAVLVDAVAPVLATLRKDRLPLQAEHLPERFGLLIILVLGEALGGAARGVHDASWAAPSVVLGVLGLVVACSMWWVYFDVGGAHGAEQLQQADAEREHEDADQPVSDVRHDLFVYGHLPLAFGTVLVGVSLEDVILHRDLSGDWVLAVGLGLFLVGIAMIVAGTSRTWRSVWPWPLAFVPLVVVLAVLPLPSALVLVVAYAVLVLVLSVHGTLARRHSGTELGSTD